MISLLKKPSAWIPIAIPLVFFLYIIITIVTVGVVRQEDEGIAAHLFQLWLILEPFMLGYFVFKWLPTDRKNVLLILALQIVAAALPILLVFGLRL